MKQRMLFLVTMALAFPSALRAEPLANTKPLDTEGDLAAQMVDGIDKYLMKALADSVEARRRYWKADHSSPEAYLKSIEPNRERLRKILGVVDERVPARLEYVATPGQKSLVAETKKYSVYTVRWRVLDGVDAEGLLLEPKERPIACVVALPDADWTPEMLVGLAQGVPAEGQFARHLAGSGCRVLVPMLIDRSDIYSGSPLSGRWTNQPHREFIYRMAYEMGRHVIGYEVQKVLAAVDWFCQDDKHPPICVIGYGEGGLLALYSAALDPRIKATVVSGYFGPREAVWAEPIYRNVWCLLREFGDADLAALIAPRKLIIETGTGPTVDGPPKPGKGRAGAAPGSLKPPASSAASAEIKRALQCHGKLIVTDKQLMHVASKSGQPGSKAALDALIENPITIEEGELVDLRGKYDPQPRLKRQFQQVVDFTQKVFRESHFRRDELVWKKLDLDKIRTLEAKERLAPFEKNVEPLRNYFYEDVIGKLPAPTLPLSPRTRLAYDTPKWRGYEVVLDVYPDVFAYGILLVPKDLKDGEKRPVVVCQHGLEGRPQDVVNPKEKTRAYNSFGAQLANRGYIVYAPQNPYIGQDKFRVLQRKGNPLGLSLFSFITRQHERTIDWLETLPFVDKERIGFYGLSYGGKTAMRVPALEKRYCLSICSGDFNEWIWKNVNLEWRGSYVTTGEYEMFEFDLGPTFNYAEMCSLIAPRPFMVERGHDDGVGLDEYVAFEFAKVRRMYSRLGIPGRTTIEYFDGGHVINGKGTFEFLDKHLNWKGTE
ncbi:MAG: dienelactone hydrolase family protein [Gemmataceae bacterium]